MAILELHNVNIVIYSKYISQLRPEIIRHNKEELSGRVIVPRDR